MAVSLAPLPIDEVLPELIAALRAKTSVVLRAPPGAGKTTRVPPALLDAGLVADGKIVVLQPRRVAARAAAARIAAERGAKLGEEIGYQVRFESKTSRRTRIEVITEGILLRRLNDQPFLEGTAVVIFDEFHERSLSSDLSLGMVRQLQQTVRPDLRIVVMSATLAAAPVAAYLNNCPTVESRGRTFEVEIRYSPLLAKRPLEDQVAEGVEHILAATPGDCLVFLPGVGEIRAAARRLERLAQQHDLAVLPLYGDLPAEEQDAVLRPGERRKVILATNVAETSLTIEGVTGVVDSGLARVLRYDERTGLDHLELSTISKASADQRAGRAGRTRPGVCLRLWPEAAQRIRAEFETAEIQRVDLAGAALAVLCWMAPDLAAFPWFEPPSAAALAKAVSLLQRLEAYDGEQVTPLGRAIAELPVHPRLGRLLIAGGQWGVGRRAALAAALLAERDPFLRGAGQEGRRRGASHRSQSDVLDRILALEQFAENGVLESDVGQLHRGGANLVLRSRDQLARLLESAGVATVDAAISSDEAILRALLAAFPDRVARRRERGGKRAIMIGGRGVRLADQSAVADEELFLCVDLEGGASEALVRQASAIQRSWLCPSFLRTEIMVAFDEQLERVTAKNRLFWDTLVLEEGEGSQPSDEQVSVALVAASTTRLEKVFPADDPDVAGFLSRVRCLASWRPDLNLPVLDDDALRGLLPLLCAGCRSLAAVRRAPWQHALRSLFNYQQLQTVAREAPERIEVPSGSQIAIQYEAGRPPILAVRIQEVFGLLETPRIAGGRIPVLLHLLAPNMRTAQVTDDLKSFWAYTYALVRKDLRARYPKHSWPENPYEAVAQRRPGRK